MITKAYFSLSFLKVRAGEKNILLSQQDDVIVYLKNLELISNHT